MLKFNKPVDYSRWLNFNSGTGMSLATLGWNEVTQGVVCDSYYSILYNTQSHNYDVNIDYNSFYKDHSNKADFYTNANYDGVDYTGDCILMFNDYPVVRISGAAFKDSTVTKVYLENNIAVMTGNIFSGNTYLRELRIPDSCTLFALSLNGCTNLRLLTIGKYTSYLYGVITSGCTSLNEIRFRSTEPPHSSTNNLFQDVASTGVMKVPYGSNLGLYTQILPSGWTLEQYSIS